MGVVQGKSKAITQRDAGQLTNACVAKGGMLEAIGAVGIGNGDSIGSTYIVGSVPSNARISDVLVSAPDIGTTTAADIGLYRNTADGGAVVDADFFVAAQSLKDGAIDHKQVAFLNVITLANAEKMIWEALGLSKDPNVTYDIVLTLTGAADAAGTVMVKTRYAA